MSIAQRLFQDLIDSPNTAYHVQPPIELVGAISALDLGKWTFPFAVLTGEGGRRVGKRWATDRHLRRSEEK